MRLATLTRWLQQKKSPQRVVMISPLVRGEDFAEGTFEARVIEVEVDQERTAMMSERGRGQEEETVVSQPPCRADSMLT